MAIDTKDAVQGEPFSEGEEVALQLGITVAPKLNLALQQNSVPLIRELYITNTSQQTFESLRLSVHSDPDFCEPRAWVLDRFAADSRFYVTDVKIDISRDFLENLEEAVKGHVIFDLRLGDKLITTQREEIDILAKDEWGGSGDLPEIIAAFVQPNDAVVELLLREASKRLRAAGLDGSFDGYQAGNPKRVAQTVSAMWSAVSALELSYAMPPASFERMGQKIRSPRRIYEKRLATCLDLSVLFASCLEQAGLHPVIVFTKGHAFPGCWLQDEDFSRAVIDDVQALRKRVQLKELIVFESTLVAQSPPGKFTFSMLAASEKLEKEGEFGLAVDIKRARVARIRPVSVLHSKEEEVDNASVEEQGTDIPIDIPAGLPERTDREPESHEDGEPSETPDARLERWKRKLLDLSLRNKLLHFRGSTRAIVIRCPDPAKLEDILANGKKLKILSEPEASDSGDPRSQTLYREQRQEDMRTEHALRALARGELLVNQPEDKLQAVLLDLYRVAHSAVEEGGANILYLAIGFLTWTQTARRDRKLKAPLILVPVHLTRQSVRSGFRLVLHEDEPRLNPTLLEMLRQDFGLRLPDLEDELPTDGHGLDVQRIWETIRRAVRDIPGWEVTEDIVLSTFLFVKHLMWKDLQDRTDQLKRNPIVKHLLETPREPYTGNDIDFLRSEALDERVRPEEIYCPLPIDSSQLAAVIAAAEGKDFVLIGPPGTGKSQTIANMISQCLAAGQTVLFVSEKTAALDVVYRRLRDVGLGEFCLELHSNKARKFDVLKQLESAWAASGELDQEGWMQEAARLGALRDKLNAYVRHLHYVHMNGWSPYRAMGEVIHNRDVPYIQLSWPSGDAHSQKDFAQLEDIVKRIDVHAQQVGGIAANPFFGIGRGEWSPSWQADFLHAIRALARAIENLAHCLRSYRDITACPIEALDAEQLRHLSRLNGLLLAAHGQPYGFLFSDNSTSTLQDMQEVARLLQAYQDAYRTMSCKYKRTATQIDLDALTSLWDTGKNSWWLKRAMIGRKVRKVLRTVAEDGVISKAIDHDLAQLTNARKQENAINDFQHLAHGLGRIWRGLDTDLGVLNAAVQWAVHMQRALIGLSGNPDDLMSLRSAVGRLVQEGNELLAPGAVVYQRLQALEDAYGTFQRALDTVSTLSETDGHSLSSDGHTDYLAELSERCQAWLAAEAKLRYWCAWRAVRQEALAKNLAKLVEAIEEGTVTGTAAAQIFRVNYCRWWINAVIDKDDVLRTFVPAEHELRINEFRQLTDKFILTTRQYVRARLCGHIPDRRDIARGSEWSVLSRELQKKRRHMPLRQLIDKMPNTLTKLTPCVMMSPLSIAQYLPTDTAPFDVVIFDEASQIPVWDAVGAIARGKQAIVVGDPRQLPPTSFFERRADADNDQDVEVEDLESILDECIGASVPTRQLNWHYRSLSESLIAFSNHRYYQGRLITFPAPATDDLAVRYVHVPEGVYEKGGARVNKAEARAVVAAIVERLRSPEFKESIGVVTFNTEQQRLIQDSLEEERRRNPAIESHFAEDNVEPIFVKNLESVQGDERDIIYFSVTYGPDATGHVSMNFGPLNQEGGQRRLNVAITRARREMHVYATLRPEKIDLGRTSAEGVRDLKHFLEFAERGRRALAEAIVGSQGEFESFFERAVAAALSNRGWIVHPQVGVSAFRIDLGVVHPDAPGRYLAGIECDGATYHRSATARDRDFLREQILRRLGWEIIRIWSTDWWTDPQSALEKVHHELEKLLMEDHEQAEEVQSIPSDTYATVAENAAGNRESLALKDERIAIDLDDDHAGIEEIPACAGKINGAAFEEPSYTPILKELVCCILDREAPIRTDILARRIARLHGFRRTSARIRERIDKLVEKNYPRTHEDKYQFYWPKDTSPEDWVVFREPANNRSRNVDEVPMQELHALAQAVTADGFSGEAAIGAMAARLGLQRLRTPSRERLERALRSVLEKRQGT